MGVSRRERHFDRFEARRRNSQLGENILEKNTAPEIALVEHSDWNMSHLPICVRKDGLDRSCYFLELVVIEAGDKDSERCAARREIRVAREFARVHGEGRGGASDGVRMERPACRLQREAAREAEEERDHDFRRPFDARETPC